MSKRAVIIVDLQKDYLATGSFALTGIDAAAANAARVVEAARRKGDRIVLVFHPTADGLPHRLELRRDGAALVGDYVADGNGIRRTVRAEPAIEG